MNLRQQLDNALSDVETLKIKIAKATCVEAGHNMVFSGGRNAGCNDDCRCSIPVYECKVCGACDFGENEEAEVIISECKSETKEK
jgi:hypothetical protein